MSRKGKDVFISPTKGRLDITKVVAELVDFMEEAPESAYRLVIGTDSKTKRLKKAVPVRFVTAVVIHRIGKGGRYFWTKKTIGKIVTLRDKIYQETLLSIKIAQKLVPILKSQINGEREKYQLEIHIDIGHNGPTRGMIKEVVGIVRGNGYEAKIKPESYGACSVADKHT